MRALTTEECDLLRYLDERGGWTTSKVLAAHFGVSVRKVKYLVSAINANIPLVESSRLGYATRPEQKERIVQILNDASEAAEPQALSEDRRMSLLTRLILADGRTDLYDLAEELYVNVVTLRREMLALQPFLVSSGLRFEMTGSLWAVAGDEAARRRAMSRLLAEEAQRGFVVRQTMFGAYGAREARTIREILDRRLAASGLATNDYALLTLTCHLLVALERAQDGHRLDAVCDASLDGCALACAQGVLGDLEESFKVELGGGEVADFAALVDTFVAPDKWGGSGEASVCDVVDEGTWRLVQEIVACVKRDLFIDLGEGEDLVRFALHLKSLLLRCGAGVQGLNPIASYIKLASPLVHEACVRIAAIIGERTGFHVSDDEIAFLALHLSMLSNAPDERPRIAVALAAPRYHRLVDRMADRIEASCGDAAVALVVSNEDDLREVEEGADVIVSTITLARHYRQEVVYLTPMLSDAEIESVRKAVARVAARRELIELEELADRMMRPSLFCHMAGAESFDSVVEGMCASMRDEGCVGEGYLALVREREMLSPTTYGVVSIPHSLKPAALESAIGVTTLERPLQRAGEKTRLILLLAIRPGDELLFNTFFNRLVALLTEGDNAQRLARCTTLVEFRETLHARAAKGVSLQ